jgi:PST family polysaccharide transporter
MNEAAASYRRILKSSSIIGGATVFTIVIGVLRTKALAVLLGPSAVGLVSLYAAIITTATAFGSMGLGTAGPRQVAHAATGHNERALAVTRRAVSLGGLLLAVTAALVIWSLRDVLAMRLLDGEERASDVGWLALGVGLSIAATSQSAQLQGMRRIGAMAQLSIFSALINTVTGIGMLWHWGQVALVAYVLLAPAASFALGCLYVSRLPKEQVTDVATQDVLREWKCLLQLGGPFMAAAAAGSLVQFWMRLEVSRALGIDALGYFQAAWTISLQYIGLILTAMAADYYPRLTAVIHDRAAAARLVNEQTEIALLLSAPLLIGMMALAPWVISALYSSAFLPAAEVLRWQVFADVLKVASWPLGFVMLAAGDGKAYFWTETVCVLTIGSLIAWLAPLSGLKITGIAFLVGYLFYLPLVYFLAWRRIDLRWSKAASGIFGATIAACAVVSVVSQTSEWGALAGCLLAAIFFLYGARRLWKMGDLAASGNPLFKILRQFAGKLGL